MSDSGWTRFVRLRADVEREDHRNEMTSRTGWRERVEVVDHRALFNYHQRRLLELVRGHGRAGVAVFALHRRAGIAGHLWLAATDQLRAGTIGRHSSVDLFLADDGQLSLRHLLVLVQMPSHELRVRVADLATPAGFQAEQGGVLRAVDANGTLALRAAGYSLFFIPTGGPPVWDATAEDPWSTLPPRVVVADARPSRPSRRWRFRQRPSDTNVRPREGPSETGPEPLLQPHERIEGHLIIASGAIEQRLAASARALDRGILLGRYSRCAGSTGEMSYSVSRVHAALVRWEGELHLIDTGSTNGTFKGDRRVKCEPLEPGFSYGLGRLRVRWEPAC